MAGSKELLPMSSAIAHIHLYPRNPLDLLKELLVHLEGFFVTMNLATLDREFGVLNRTVVYRGIVEGAITFVTERNSRKYQNIKDNPKVAITFLFPHVPSLSANDQYDTWQVRLIDAEAVELSPGHVAKFWASEAVYAKIRSHICMCGSTIDPEEQKRRHDQLLADYQSGHNKLEQTSTYTAFKIVPQRWDFYKSSPQKIADRVQYKKVNNEWKTAHVAA